MADKTSTTNQCYIDLTLSRSDNTQQNRRLTFDVADTSLLPNIKPAILFGGIQDSLVGGGLSTFIQPSNWRDSDDEEEEWTCTGIAAGLITKTETEFDLG